MGAHLLAQAEIGLAIAVAVDMAARRRT